MPPLKNRSYVSQRTIDELRQRMGPTTGDPARKPGAWPPRREWIGVIALLAALLGMVFVCVALPLLVAAFARGRPFPADIINRVAFLILWCGVLGSLLVRKDLDRVDRVLGNVCLMYLPLPAALMLINPDPRFAQGMWCGFAALAVLSYAFPDTDSRDMSRLGSFVRRAAQALCVVALACSLLFVLPIGIQLYAAFPGRIIASNLLLGGLLLFLMRSIARFAARSR